MTTIRRRSPFALLLAFSLVTGCSEQDEGAQRGRGGPTQVGFVVVQPTAVPVQSQLGGRTVAFETSAARATS